MPTAKKSLARGVFCNLGDEKMLRCTAMFYAPLFAGKYRSPDFGHVDHGIMILNDTGKIVHKHWLKIPKRFSCMFLDEFILMPDHIHGLIRIKHGELHQKRQYIKDNQKKYEIGF